MRSVPVGSGRASTRCFDPFDILSEQFVDQLIERHALDLRAGDTPVFHLHSKIGAGDDIC